MMKGYHRRWNIKRLKLAIIIVKRDIAWHRIKRHQDSEKEVKILMEILLDNHFDNEYIVTYFDNKFIVFWRLL